MEGFLVGWLVGWLVGFLGGKQFVSPCPFLVASDVETKSVLGTYICTGSWQLVAVGWRGDGLDRLTGLGSINITRPI